MSILVPPLCTVHYVHEEYEGHVPFICRVLKCYRRLKLIFLRRRGSAPRPSSCSTLLEFDPALKQIFTPALSDNEIASVSFIGFRDPQRPLAGSGLLVLLKHNLCWLVFDGSLLVSQRSPNSPKFLCHIFTRNRRGGWSLLACVIKPSNLWDGLKF